MTKKKVGPKEKTGPKGTQGDNCKDMERKKRWKNHCATGENHVPFNQHRAV